MTRLRIRFSPSITIATAALVVSLTGSAIAAQPASHPSSGPVYTTLQLKNGWTGGPFNTAKPAATLIQGIVHLKGAMQSNKTNAVAFTLPAAFRPAKNVYVTVDMANATNGRLYITTGGLVTVEAEAQFANALTFTSLDGASFAR